MDSLVLHKYDFGCRENLSKDLYLISQMDTDNFVPVWAVACMEDIKALTADVDLIVDVLRGISAAALLFCDGNLVLVSVHCKCSKFKLKNCFRILKSL